MRHPEQLSMISNPFWIFILVSILNSLNFGGNNSARYFPPSLSYYLQGSLCHSQLSAHHPHFWPHNMHCLKFYSTPFVDNIWLLFHDPFLQKSHYSTYPCHFSFLRIPIVLTIYTTHLPIFIYFLELLVIFFLFFFIDAPSPKLPSGVLTFDDFQSSWIGLIALLSHLSNPISWHPISFHSISF